MALPSTVACLPRTHPSLVFLTGASAAGPEGTHGEESGAGWEEAKLRPPPRGGKGEARFLSLESVQQEVSVFLLRGSMSTASFNTALEVPGIGAPA